MPSKILSSLLSLLLFQPTISFAVNDIPSSPIKTDCAKDPAVTQKKMTHILRSLACSQAKSLGECESIAGLSNTAKAAIAGGAAATAVAVKYRSQNVASCKFSKNEDSFNAFSQFEIAWTLLLAPLCQAASPSGCQRLHAKGSLTSTSQAASTEVKGLVEKQTAELAKQTKNLDTLKSATQKSTEAAAEYQKALSSYYDLDTQMKDYSSQVEKVKSDLAKLKVEMQATASTSPKYQMLEKEEARLVASSRDWQSKLLARKKEFGLPEEFRQRLQSTMAARDSAKQEVAALEKTFNGNLDTQKVILQAQESQLADYKAASSQYEKTVKLHSLNAGSEVQAALDGVKSAGAVSEAHAKSLAQIQFLLDTAEKNEALGVVQKAAAGASKSAALRAMASLSAKSLGRVGVKILGGVIAAAGSQVVLAGELALGGNDPGDKACLMSDVEKEPMLGLMTFSAQNHCRPSPVIKDIGAFGNILNLSANDQIYKYYNNRNFCEWLNDVYNIHSPKIKATCSSTGASYTTENGKHEQFSWAADGSLNRFDSYGEGQENDDGMYSIYLNNNKIESFGVMPIYKQEATEKSFKSKAFDSKSQLQFKDIATEKNGAQYKQRLASFDTNFRLQALNIAEIKSCCNPQDPAVEDSTCYTRYGISTTTTSQSLTSTDNSSNSTKTPQATNQGKNGSKSPATRKQGSSVR